MRILVVIALVCFSLSSIAADGKFGLEWTFTNQDIIDRATVGGDGQRRGDAVSAWMEIIERKCPNCRIDGQRVYFDKERTKFFQVNTDPWVVELQASPMTVKEMTKHKNILQSLVFDAAAEAGVKPHYQYGGGHIHLDKETHFGKNKLLMRNFIVDLMNHPELFMGILGKDFLNGPPLAIHDKEMRETFKRVLKEYDGQRQKNINNLIEQISDSVYQRNFVRETVSDSSAGKYQLLNLRHSQTLEIRGLRPQQSVEHHIRLTALFEARIKYLKKIKKPIKYIEKDYSEKASYSIKNSIHTHKTTLAPKELVKVFEKYVTEAGLDFADYKVYLHPKLINIKKSGVKIGRCLQAFAN